MLMFCVFLFIFFFKQKTAYVWRISDCGSDVCSSDRSLAPSLAVIFMKAPVPFWPCTEVRIQASLTSMVCAWAEVPATQKAERAAKIGRASCRVRVCQYV